VLEPAEHDGGEQLVGLAVGLRHQESDDGQFGDVELEVAHDALERGVGHLDVREVELEARALHDALLERQGDRIVAEQCL